MVEVRSRGWARLAGFLAGALAAILWVLRPILRVIWETAVDEAAAERQRDREREVAAENLRAAIHVVEPTSWTASWTEAVAGIRACGSSAAHEAHSWVDATYTWGCPGVPLAPAMAAVPSAIHTFLPIEGSPHLCARCWQTRVGGPHVPA